VVTLLSLKIRFLAVGGKTLLKEMGERLICLGATKLAELVFNVISLSILQAKNYISRTTGYHAVDRDHESASAPFGRRPFNTEGRSISIYIAIVTVYINVE
jgi:hypothetical protein